MGGGYDIQIRLSPFIREFIDVERVNAIECDRALVEFLRVNGFIGKRLGIDTSEYVEKHAGYRHLPLETKVALVGLIKKEISVCEDVPIHWEYWRKHVNANPEDCCNLRF